MKAKVLFLTFSLLVATMVPSFGQDGKVYPGLMGARLNSSQPVPDVYFDGFLNPSSTNALEAAFPVIHDSINHSIKKGWISVLDQHPSQAVEVKLLSNYRDKTGFWGWQTAWIGSGGNSTNYQQLNFNGIGSNTKSAHYIRANIPPTHNGHRSGVIRYYVEENN